MGTDNSGDKSFNIVAEVDKALRAASDFTDEIQELADSQKISNIAFALSICGLSQVLAENEQQLWEFCNRLMNSKQNDAH